MSSALVVIAALLTCVALSSDAAVIETLHGFQSRREGHQAKSQLLLLRNSTTLAGYTAEGGIYHRGNVFTLNMNGSAFGNIHSFGGVFDAYEPHHAQLQQLSDGRIIGCATYGPHRSLLNRNPTDGGNLFAIDVNRRDYSIVYRFTHDNDSGYEPHSSPLHHIEKDGTEVLYGTTEKGGNDGGGTIWRYEVARSSMKELYSFQRDTGYQMHARVALDSTETLLAGMTKLGGSAGGGVLFAFNITSAEYTVYRELDNSTGYQPRHGYLTRVGSTFYGLTSLGGKAGMGTILAVEEDGSNFRVLHDFCCNATGCASSETECTFDGCLPYAEFLYLDGGPGAGYLYATTRQCGQNEKGTVVRIKPDGSDYSVVVSMDELSNSIGGLVSDPEQRRLFGTTEFGNTNGGVFVVHLDRD